MNKKRIIKGAMLISVIFVVVLLIWRDGYLKGRDDGFKRIQKMINIIEIPKKKAITQYVRISNEQRYIQIYLRCMQGSKLAIS